jgi:hypothetical protein
MLNVSRETAVFDPKLARVCPSLVLSVCLSVCVCRGGMP